MKSDDYQIHVTIFLNNFSENVHFHKIIFDKDDMFELNCRFCFRNLVFYYLQLSNNINHHMVLNEMFYIKLLPWNSVIPKIKQFTYFNCKENRIFAVKNLNSITFFYKEDTRTKLRGPKNYY